MLNLNIGDVVYHAGKKRAIEASKSVAGRTFFKLSGHAYMVRLDHVKPVIRVQAPQSNKSCNCPSCSFDKLFSGTALEA